MTKKNRTPRILFFDIETKPVLAWIWRTGYKISVSHEQIQKDQSFDIICICYQWDNESTVHTLDWGINKQDSTDMINKFTEIVESADIVVAHNADAFDIKQINSQKLLKGMDPITWPVSDDTLKAFRRYFYFPSYSLDYLSGVLNGAKKDRMGFQDWIDIVEEKDPKALKKMIRYCQKDVRLLRQIYMKAKKFLKPKYHVGILNGQNAHYSCPACGSTKSVSKGIWHGLTRMALSYQRRKCISCGVAYKGRPV